MLRELAELGQRLGNQSAAGRGAPPYYKSKNPKPTSHFWIVELGGSQPELLGPFKRKTELTVLAPDRQRSGTPSRGNLKPYLLADEARYALGMPEPGKEAEAQILHEGFVDLVEQAYRETADRDVGAVLSFLRSLKAMRPQWAQKVRPRDMVIPRVGGTFPTEKEAVQQFWTRYLEQAQSAGVISQCGVCGQTARLLRTLPKEVRVMGQKCQVVSFNLSAFRSFGKRQTTNAPLCAPCVKQFTQAMDYLLGDPRHQAVLFQRRRDQQGSPLQNQLAIFWLREPAQVEADGRSIDLEEAFQAFLSRERNELPSSGPPPDLKQLQALLQLPWKPKGQALEVADNAFYLAVLSANKGRLVVREWIQVSLEMLRQRLGDFLQCSTIVGPGGEDPVAFPLPAILRALEAGDPNLSRGLLRSAFVGYPLPPEVATAALRRLHAPKGRNKRAVVHPLASALKLVLAYTKGKEVWKHMVQLDVRHRSQAYLCGRLLAVLEEAQRRASGGRIKATLVDKAYGAACSSPNFIFGHLVRIAQTAHLPKMRREGRGHAALESLLQELMAQIDGAGGFPAALPLPEQAEFALGFYQQRAALRGPRDQR